MMLTDLLSESLILPDLKAQTKKATLRELADAVARVHPTLDADRVLTVLMEREKLGTTGIGAGTAVPHGKIAGLDAMVAAVGRSFSGVDFQSGDGEPVNLFVLLLAPDGAQNVHLQALAKICRMLKNRDTFEGLMQAESAAEMLEVLRKEDEKH